MWCGDGSLKASEKNKVQRKTTIEILLLFLEKLLIGLEEGSGFVWIEEKPKGTKLTFRKHVCDVCMKVKDYFCKVVAGGIFSFERLKSSMLLILFSFFEVKIPPPILPEVFVLIFANQFHLCQLMFQSLLFAFHQIKSQKQNGSSESLIGGNLRTSC